ARQYLDSDDVALRTNARCTPITVAGVRLVNERGEARDLEPGTLGAVGALVLYEPDTLDEQGRLDVADSVPAWGEAKPRAAWLNPLTKLCVDDTADFNGNGLSDLDEGPGAELGASTAWMQPFLQVAHFAELHTVTVDPADGGRLVIAEKPRCAEGFPLDTLADLGAHWKECERRRDVRYREGQPGFDLAQFTCGDMAGSCPGLTVAERAPAGAVQGACSGPAAGRFTGMQHHSQFACLRLTENGGQGRVELTSRVGGPLRASRCTPGEAGAATCAPVAAPETGDVLWITTVETAPSTDGYVNGCVAECDGLVATCPGYDADPDQNAAGCATDRANFGALVCNGCPGSGAPCVLAAGERPDVLGVCRQGFNDCVDGNLLCVPSRAPDPGDAFGDGVDANCDGFDGDLAHAIFVSSAAGGRADGSPQRPYRTLSAALLEVEARRDDVAIYMAAGDLSEAGEVVVPSNLLGLFGGLSTGVLACGDAASRWCVGAAADRTRLAVTAN
ncbi:MAG: hypothetical protein KC613_22320, partial [Myxococcales bacterium]|nr:hypothetical protein [Myxococcales bacterium]